MFLGELEKLVLQYLWETESADAKQVFAYFEKSRGGTLNTIQSTLDRLFKKGLLAREKHGHAFQYRAAVDRDVFIGRLITNISSDFGSSGENMLLAAFNSLSNGMDEKQLDELERLIDERRLKANSDRQI
ncbi:MULTISPECIES: BlaI/MecI/CopY family transcriptional regulator [Cycloclasticus]|jgi:predicted transcriptional regulator|uniref:Transcriptional regulator n=1 Tax=Cycloclasticus zancles 78-ME TaxID=1198232 RepID=S5TGX7_9GAMM|nr:MULTISPECIES: BlaI/MecI/CopY family transcriptional regulator [Cycloclasticus]AGS40127.1 Transcriptional regulator [Cycloclasticus zancles 78-ME]MDF1829276.1 BlaI/MecI/CopY family transcriptional regulator [Cycloclasticus pugetii]PHR52041.1 MAG: TrmB family transcriptional regulator [Cycloclasticus sp.]